MKKLPWGIIMGVCAMFVFFLTVGTIAVYMLLNGVAAQTNDTASFFGEWYQVLMFVFDIVFALGFAGSLTMFILREKADRAEEAA
ncbi:MAG: hypothetical protein HFJ21_06205 [Clostridia bacterium]|nr:hypothetical protein [Clostridia bacterium]